MTFFREVADIKTADQLNLPTPEVEYHNVVAKPTEIQKEFVKTLSKGEQSDSISLSFRKNLLEKEELLVYSLLDFCPTGIGTLAEKTSIPLGSLLLLLESLVQKGFIKEEVPNFFTRTL